MVSDIARILSDETTTQEQEEGVARRVVQEIAMTSEHREEILAPQGGQLPGDHSEGGQAGDENPPPLEN